MRISDWSSDVCSSDLISLPEFPGDFLQLLDGSQRHRHAGPEAAPGTVELQAIGPRVRTEPFGFRQPFAVLQADGITGEPRGFAKRLNRDPYDPSLLQHLPPQIQ